MFLYLYVLLITQNKTIMELFSTILLVTQLVLFILVLSNMANLFINYLLTKIK